MSNELLKTKSVAILITQKCTLNCQLCGAYVTRYTSPQHANKETIYKEIDKIFEIYDYIEFFDITGGEPLMHPDIAEIVSYALKYTNQFSNLRITTNGTVLPSPALIKVAKNGQIIFKLDDYGELSKRSEEVVALLEGNDIPIRVVKYFGSDQHCDGWIDFGDFTDKDYSEEDLNKVFDNCYAGHWICLAARNGKLHICTYALVGDELGMYTPVEGQYIDLFDETVSVEKKKKMALDFGTKSVEACKLCNGFDPENSKRYPAAKQINRDNETK